MPRCTGHPVLHPKRVDISRDASESCGKTRKEGKCKQQQNTSRKNEKHKKSTPKQKGTSSEVL
ncbi:hypothetical protein DPMN_131521 [Dreissena polymorpha]|uniref:Uncharacterized protein n=1 Tax=Dreissena polymorpha TaxID=45954 RepID=A0A9D4H6R8_DREPO|nr:hypothetical protein DPMN_131521 [Dreissena polymorpha]